MAKEYIALKQIVYSFPAVSWKEWYAGSKCHIDVQAIKEALLEGERITYRHNDNDYDDHYHFQDIDDVVVWCVPSVLKD